MRQAADLRERALQAPHEVESPLRPLRRLGGVQARVAGQGRLLVRYSGTEPLLRVMIEGEDQASVQAWAEEIAEAVRLTLA